MSYTRLDAAEPAYARTPVFLPALGRLGRVVVWSVVNVGLLFAEQLAELLAPVLLFGGAVWWAVPKLLATITLEGQANDVLQMVRARVPTEMYLNGEYVSASILIHWGIWAVAVVAVCRTLSTALAALLLDRR